MNTAAFYLGGTVIYWSAIVITLGALAALLMTLSLYKGRSSDSTAVWVMFPIAFVIGTVLSRITHWYFNGEAYESFIGAMTDYSIGSFCLPGMIVGLLLAAWIVRKIGLTKSANILLDCAAPGLCLLIALIRFSALFNSSCRSKIVITQKWLQFLPFASGVTDTAGNITYRFATFFIEFILMAIVTVVIWKMYRNRNAYTMKGKLNKNGNVIKAALVLYGVIEIVMDSTRNDSPLMHFRFLSALNQYSAFISLAQVFAAIVALVILIDYTKKSVTVNGFKFYHPLIWIGFFASVFGIGKLGEYNVQRTGQYLKCYSIMTISCILLAAMVFLMLRTCIEEDDY